MDIKPTILRKRSRSGDGMKDRSISVSYHLNIEGKNEEICIACFMRTFDVTNNTRSDADRELAVNHILSVTSYESHNTRERSQQKIFAATLYFRSTLSGVHINM
jgi:hypothetical protein